MARTDDTKRSSSTPAVSGREARSSTVQSGRRFSASESRKREEAALERAGTAIRRLRNIRV